MFFSFSTCMYNLARVLSQNARANTNAKRARTRALDACLYRGNMRHNLDVRGYSIMATVKGGMTEMEIGNRGNGGNGGNSFSSPYTRLQAVPGSCHPHPELYCWHLHSMMLHAATCSCSKCLQSICIGGSCKQCTSAPY